MEHFAFMQGRTHRVCRVGHGIPWGPAELGTRRRPSIQSAASILSASSRSRHAPPWKHPIPAAAARHGAANLCLREVGDLLPRRFARRAAGSEDLVMRLQIHRKLNRHTGCMNTVGFNADGDTLISGSDDQMVILLDWDTGVVKLEFHSGHGDNAFQARFMPYTNDRTIVTCAADGKVRLANIQDGGDVPTTLLGEHDGRAHKLAIEPGSPYIFYSCGEDGLVQHFDLRTNTATNLFLCRNSLSEAGSSSHISSGIDNYVKIWTPSATERAQVVHVDC